MGCAQDGQEMVEIGVRVMTRARTHGRRRARDGQRGEDVRSPEIVLAVERGALACSHALVAAHAPPAHNRSRAKRMAPGG